MKPTALHHPGVPASRHPFTHAAGRAIAFVIGWLLMFAGLGMGVTVVLLPFGIVVGILGVLIVLGAIAEPGLED